MAIKQPSFVDAVVMRQTHPETFYLPEEHLRLSVGVGQWAKVCAEPERFWVEVVEVLEDGRYIGRVDNHLVFTEMHDIVYDDLVYFGPENIYDILEE